MASKRNHLFQGLLFRFHVKFQGCTLNIIKPTLPWDSPRLSHTMKAEASSIDIAAAAMPTHTVMFVDVDTGTLQGLFLAAGREPTSQFQKHDRYVSYKRLEINSNHDGFFSIFLVETLVFRDCPFRGRQKCSHWAAETSMGFVRFVFFVPN